MRCLAEFALLTISITLVQSQPVVHQIANLNAIFSSTQVEKFLTPDKLQQLQNQIIITIFGGLGNHWDAATLGKALQQLVTQYMPQVTQMSIDWEAVGQSALDDVAISFPDTLIDTMGGFFSKRDLSDNELQFLSQLPTESLAQIVEVVNIPDKRVALVKLRQLLRQFFPTSGGRDDFDDLAENMLNRLDDLLPHFTQSPSSISD